jgi:hypothetical protein
MSKSYKKSHSSDKAYSSHKSKIRERGGSIESDEKYSLGAYKGFGHTLKYKFPK